MSLSRRNPSATGCLRLIMGVAAGAAVLVGCLVIPTDYYSAGSRHNLSAGAQPQIQPGVTTKEEVFLLLGEPDHASDDGQCLGYAWQKVKAVWIVAAGYSGASGEIEHSHLLQISFDASNRVSRLDMLKRWGHEVPPERAPESK